MSVLDFSLRQPIQLLVGSLDLSSCLQDISWGQAAHEPEQPLVWQGQLTLKLSRAAELAGITASTLSPLASPQYWLPGVQPVRLTVGSLPTLTFRLSDWAYNATTKTGSGKLTQQLALYNQSFPELDPDLIYSGSSIGVEQAVLSLLDSVNYYTNDKMLVEPSLVDLQSGAVIYGKRSTKSPIGEAQSYCKHAWAWCYQTLTTEQVGAKALDYTSLQPLLSRAQVQAYVVPAEDEISFAAPRAIAYGSADYPAPKCNSEPPPNSNAQGFPLFQETTERKPIGSLMPDVYGKLSYEIDSLKKRIDYSYRVKRPTNSVVRRNLSITGTEYEPAEVLDNQVLNESSQLYKTVTTVWEPAGVLMPDNYRGMTNLVVSSVTTETALYKEVLRPAGIVLPEKSPGLLSLVTQSYEKLTTPITKPTNHGIGKNGQCAPNDYVKPAPVQVLEEALETRNFRGEALIQRGYRPALTHPLTYNIGWCPSDQAAALVAEKLALREQARKLSDNVTLALPTEWLSAGCPPFCSFVVHDKLYFVDKPQASIKVEADGRRRATLSFTGLPLATVSPVAAPAAPTVYDPATFTGNSAEARLASVPASFTTVQGSVLNVSL